MLSVSRAVLVLVVACGGVEVFGACTCREDFAYFTEISNEAHYNYSDFPYLEYEGGLNSVVGRWYRTRTSFLFKSNSLEHECYAPFSDNCNLAFQTFYRYLWTVNWIYDRNDVCPLPGQDIVDAVAGICTQEPLCGSTYETWEDMADDFVDFTSYFFHCAGPEEGNVVSEAPLSRIGLATILLQITLGAFYS